MPRCCLGVLSVTRTNQLEFAPHAASCSESVDLPTPYFSKESTGQIVGLFFLVGTGRCRLSFLPEFF